jgi:hypothetical protein
MVTLLNAELSNKLIKSAPKAFEATGKSVINVPNDKKVMLEYVAELERIANDIGVDFAATNYTFSVAKSNKVDQVASIYQPNVLVQNDVPVLVWGDAQTPISELKGVLAIVEDKGFFLEVETPDEYYYFRMSIKKDITVDLATLKLAFKKGKLASYLSQGFVRPNSLVDLRPDSEDGQAEYIITGTETYDYQGTTKYNIMVSDADGKPLGLFRSNTAISKAIDGIEITPERPAYLTIYGDIRKTSNGTTYVLCSVVTTDMLELDEYDLV